MRMHLIQRTCVHAHLHFPLADRAKVHVGMVKHESEGAATMRSILGDTATPQVEVCFSQKYSDQLDRIRTNWMPIYTNVFPTVRAKATAHMLIRYAV